VINILIVDERNAICHSLGTLLANCKGFNVLGFALDGIEALRQVALKEPDIVMIDAVMPKMTGIEATKRISRLFPQVKVIVISASNNLNLGNLISAGAKGYLLKNKIFHDAELAIRTVHEGGTYFASNTNYCKLSNRSNSSVKYKMSSVFITDTML
jgi:DNA-binding NarL/FixJ family response regulator